MKILFALLLTTGVTITQANASWDKTSELLITPEVITEGDAVKIDYADRYWRNGCFHNDPVTTTVENFQIIHRYNSYPTGDHICTAAFVRDGFTEKLHFTKPGLYEGRIFKGAYEHAQYLLRVHESAEDKRKSLEKEWYLQWYLVGKKLGADKDDCSIVRANDPATGSCIVKRRTVLRSKKVRWDYNIYTIRENTVITPLEYDKYGWSKISYEGKVGYVRSGSLIYIHPKEIIPPLLPLMSDK